MNHKYTFLRIITVLLFLVGQSAYAQQNITGKITDYEEGIPIQGVSIQIKGSNAGTISAADGFFSLKAKSDDVLLFSFIGYKNQEIKVANKVTFDIKLASSQISLNEVVVVGSRGGQARSNIQTPAPVDVITAKEITATGRVDLTQILNFVAPSLVSNRQSGGDGTAHIDPVSLRGVAPDQTLVLVNGKRRHSSALLNVLGTPSQASGAVDFNAIPIGAIERIEVLRDGAAAQYGSDAIAGVINIVLKSDVDKLHITTTSGGYVTNFRNKKDGFTFQTDLNYGFRIGKNGFINVTGQINNRQATDRSGFFEYKNRLTDAPLYWFPYAIGTSESTIQAKENSVDRYSSAKSGNGNQDNAGLFVNALFPLSENLELYAFGGVASKFSVSPNNAYRFPNGTTTLNSVSSRYIPELFPNGFLPENAARINDQSLTVGLRGKKNGWDIDFSNTNGSNQVNYTIQNTLNVSQGISSGTKFNSGGLSFQQNTSNLGLSQRFENVGKLRSVNVAFGAEYRIENYQIIAGEEKSYKNYGDNTYITTAGGTTKGTRPAGAQAFPGYQPNDAQNQTRHNIGLYGDIEAEFSPRLLLTGALRYEKYSDFGDQLTWKTSGILKLVDNPSSSFENLSLRGAISTGFRAPSLQQQYYSATTSIPQGDGSLILSLVSNNANPVTRSFGVPQLSAETSNNFSLGLTSRFLNHFTATIDAYRIDIKNRVTLTGFFDFASINSTNTVVKGAAQLVKGLLVNYPDVNSAQFFANSIDTRTQGIDIVLNYRNRVGNGALNLSLSGNFTHTEVTDVHVPNGLTASATPEVQQYLKERIFFDRLQRTRYERGTPQSKFIFSGGYTIGRFTPNIVVSRFGEYTIAVSQSQLDSPTGGRDQTFSPKTITDITLNYQLTKGISFTAGVNNVGDVYPDQLSKENNQTGTVPWGTSAGQQFGFNGSFYYGRLTFSL
jgi:iron complex outermembrane receptor protein